MRDTPDLTGKLEILRYIKKSDWLVYQSLFLLDKII
jgi:hypothetical protein